MSPMFREDPLRNSARPGSWYIQIVMALIGTIALVTLIVALRLLLPPAPGLLQLGRGFGKRTTVFLASVAIILAAVAILVSRR
jgi:hypothetical protein